MIKYSSAIGLVFRVKEDLKVSPSCLDFMECPKPEDGGFLYPGTVYVVTLDKDGYIEVAVTSGRYAGVSGVVVTRKEVLEYSDLIQAHDDPVIYIWGKRVKNLELRKEFKCYEEEGSAEDVVL